MRATTLALWLALLTTVAQAAEKRFDFGTIATTNPPAGFRGAVGGEGPPGTWQMVMDELPTAFPPLMPGAQNINRRAVVAQLARNTTDEHFPMLIYDEDTFSDFKVTTQFKLVDGKVEQMAGLVFRWQDEKNYYYVRASGLGGSIYFYKVVDGMRSPPIGNKLPIAAGVWHELSVECRGNAIRVLLDGKEAIPELGDKTYSTGKIGFWTKSDSVTYFSDLRIEYTPKEMLAHTLVREAFQNYPRLIGIHLYASTSSPPDLKVIASTEPSEIGQPARPEIQNVLSQNMPYQGKSKGTMTVVLPLHDCNGEAVAAVKVVLKRFTGQTDDNALNRALPVVKSMEGKWQRLKDLFD